MSDVDVRAGGSATLWDDYTKKPGEPGALLGPTKQIAEDEGLKGYQAGTGIHDAASVADMNRRADSVQAKDDILGRDAAGWSDRKNNVALRVAGNVATKAELAEYNSDPSMRKVVTRARQWFTETRDAYLRGDLKMSGLQGDYVPIVDADKPGSLLEMLDWLKDHSADLDVSHPAKTRLEIHRKGDFSGGRLTDAIEAHVDAVAKQRNADPVQRKILDQIDATNKLAAEQFKETGETDEGIDDHKTRTIIDHVNHSFLGKATDGEVKASRALAYPLSAALWVADKMGFEVNRSKPLSSLAAIGGNLAAQLQVSPIRASVSHIAVDLIKKALNGEVSALPAEVASGMKKRIQMMGNWDAPEFKRYREAGIVSDYWRLDPTDTKLSLVPKALRSPLQMISFFDESSKIGTQDAMYQKFLDAGMPDEQAWQRATLANIRQQNFTAALHMPAFFSTVPGQLFGLFNRSRLGSANDIVRWAKSGDAATYAKSLGIMGSLAMLSYVGVDAWKRIHVMPELEDNGLIPAAPSMLYGMGKQIAAGKVPSTWVSRLASPKGDTAPQKFLDILGMRKSTPDEDAQLKAWKLHH